MCIMLSNTLSHVQPYTRMWRNIEARRQTTTISLFWAYLINWGY